MRHRDEYIRGDEYSTDLSVYRQLDHEFHFTLDPCANRHNAKCRKYYTKEQDGLAQSWANEVVFMNPPFGPHGRYITKWVAKACYESLERNAVVVCLLPVSSDTEWWHKYVMRASERRFIKGRLTYGGGARCPFPSVVVVFRPPEASVVGARLIPPPRDISFEVKP
jgi:phage N-6-adenine-methyltransferase